MDRNGNEIVPTGAGQINIANIDTSKAVNLLDGVEIVGRCDVDNPLCGERGAAHVFAPQKGWGA